MFSNGSHLLGEDERPSTTSEVTHFNMIRIS